MEEYQKILEVVSKYTCYGGVNMVKSKVYNTT